MDYKCSRCLYFDMCFETQACEYYTPLSEYEDEYIEMMIENGRTEFRKEWFQYINDDQ